VSWLCAQKLARLQSIVAQRAAWAEPLAQIKRLYGWLLEVEHLLDRSLAAEGETLSNVTVGTRLDRWREHMSRQLTDGSLSQLEHECLREFLQVLSNLRSHLVQCYDHQDFPRTNNDMERSIRGLKTQYRRVSGRKNWNAYLLRYGRSVAYAAWWEQDAAHRQHLEQQVGRLDHTRWRELRQESSCAHSEQLTRFRFRHKRQALLASLEERWATVTQSAPLP
jgi:Transposase IS66 family